ncbi:hypothetical protein GGR51DRAFT_562923 [Nemania sp. FL0031]|nr:hypothetical protein GGR51DRAFT_562923 [Nemania sp. FL0031]
MSHNSAFVYYTPRTPEWESVIGSQQENPRATTALGEFQQGSHEPHQALNEVEAMWLFDNTITTNDEFGNPYDNAGATTHGFDSGYEDDANEWDGNSTTNIGTESFSSEDQSSDNSSDYSDDFTSEDEEDEYLHHNGSLRGVVGGVICEFTLESESHHLNVHDPWFPYMRFPFYFRWSCCNAMFDEPQCHRALPSGPEPPIVAASLVPSSHISPDTMMVVHDGVGAGTSIFQGEPSENNSSQK